VATEAAWLNGKMTNLSERVKKLLTRVGLLMEGAKVADFRNSMIGLCQEGKSSPEALRRSTGTNSSVLERVVSASQRFGLPTRLSCVFLPALKPTEGSVGGDSSQSTVANVSSVLSLNLGLTIP